MFTRTLPLRILRMNWTGGKLKRHMRSHESNELKIQRAFFAQASQDSRKQAKARCVIANEARSPQPKQSQTRRKSSLDHTAPPRGSVHGSEHFLHGLPEAEDKCSEDISKSKNVRSFYSSQHGLLHMNDMKRKLLRQDDWLGLSSHRPVNIDFAHANKTAKIGKHQRMRRPDEADSPNRLPDSTFHRSSGKLTRKRKREHSVEELNGCFQTVSGKTALVASPPPKPQAYSLTSRLMVHTNRRQSLSWSQSGDTRLKSSILPKDDNRDYYYLDQEELPPAESDNRLVPLDQARYYGSFRALATRNQPCWASVQAGMLPALGILGKSIIPSHESSSPYTSKNQSQQELSISASAIVSAATDSFILPQNEEAFAVMKNVNLRDKGTSPSCTISTSFRPESVNPSAASQLPLALCTEERTQRVFQDSGTAIKDFVYKSSGIGKPPDRSGTKVKVFDSDFPTSEKRALTDSVDSAPTTSHEGNSERSPELDERTSIDMSQCASYRPRVWFKLDETYEPGESNSTQDRQEYFRSIDDARSRWQLPSKHDVSPHSIPSSIPNRGKDKREDSGTKSEAIDRGSTRRTKSNISGTRDQRRPSGHPAWSPFEIIHMSSSSYQSPPLLARPKLGAAPLSFQGIRHSLAIQPSFTSSSPALNEQESMLFNIFSTPPKR